jgi:dTDP-4-dehydrorhamnose 3,5-epimerase
MKTHNYFNSSIKLISNDYFKDQRGFFYESFKSKNFKNINFIQDNISFSKKKGTLRGLHFQKPPYEQAKLLYVLSGEIYDVVVDLRKNSKTYGKHFSIILSEKNCKSLFIPPGFAHGFQTLEKENIVFYSCTEYRSEGNEHGLNYNDKSLKIKWPLSNPIVTNKDKNARFLKDL